MHAFYKSGDHVSAMTAFEAAKSALLHHLGPHHPLLCSLLCKLADLYFEDGELDHALLVLHGTIELADKVLGTSHVLCAAYCMKLGHVQFSKGMIDKCILSFERALAIYENCSPSAVAEREAASCYYALAEAQMHCGKLPRATECSAKALAARELDDSLKPVNGRLPALLLQSHLQVATLAARADDAEKAIAHFEKVLRSRKLEAGNPTALNDVRGITRKILALCLRRQSLQLRTMLKATVNSPEKAATALNAALPYVARQLYSRPPKEYIADLIARYERNEEPTDSQPPVGLQLAVTVLLAEEEEEANNAAEEAAKGTPAAETSSPL